MSGGIVPPAHLAAVAPIEWKRIGLDNFEEEGRAINSPYTVEAMASLGVIFKEVRACCRPFALLPAAAVASNLTAPPSPHTSTSHRHRLLLLSTPPTPTTAQDVRARELDEYVTKELVEQHGKELAVELGSIQLATYEDQRQDLKQQLAVRRTKLMKAAAAAGSVAGSKKDRAAAQKRELALARRDAVRKQKALMEKQMGRQKKEMQKLLQFERMVMMKRKEQQKKLKKQEKKDRELKEILAARVRRQANERYAKDMRHKEALEEERIQSREESRIRFEEEEEEFRKQLAKLKREQIARSKRDAALKVKREEERAVIKARIEREAEDRRRALEKMQREAIERQKKLVARKKKEAAKFKLKMAAAQERRIRAQERDRKIQAEKVQQYHDKEQQVEKRFREKEVEEARLREIRTEELAEMARHRAKSLKRAQDHLADFIDGVIQKGEERDAYAAKIFKQTEAQRKKHNLIGTLKKDAKVAAIKRQNRMFEYHRSHTIEKLELDDRRTAIVNQSKTDLIKERKATMVKVLRMKHELAAMMAKVAVTNKMDGGKKKRRKKKRRKRKKKRSSASVAPAPMEAAESSLDFTPAEGGPEQTT